MMFILEVKEQIKAFYAKFDVYIISVFKFLLAFLSLKMINTDLGYMSRLNDTAIVVLVSLMCALLPWGMTAAMSALFIIAHFYKVSLELTAIALVLFLIMFCVYIRFGKGDSFFIVLTMVLFGLGMPYIIPLVVGLTAGISAAMPVAFGIIIYYLVQFVSGNSAALASANKEEILARFRLIVDSLLKNRQMLLMIIAFVITIVLVYTIRRLSIDFAWIIAVGVGAIVNVMILLIGEFMLDISISVGGVILGTFVAVIVALILQFFLFTVDYRRAEKVQFEDDDYVYFVKAVPKISVKKTQKNIRRINTKKTQRPVKKIPE